MSTTRIDHWARVLHFFTVRNVVSDPEAIARALDPRRHPRAPPASA